MNLFVEIKKQFKSTCKNWMLYWEIYGGWKAIIGSTYLWAAFIFTIICFPVWIIGFEDYAWFNLCNAILPNILGFTLGGYAILMAFGGKNFMELIAGQEDDEEGEPSPFMTINGAFLHFILIQLLALIFSLFSTIWEIKTGIGAFCGFFLFSYALFLSLAAAFAILKISGWYDSYVAKTNDEE